MSVNLEDVDLDKIMLSPIFMVADNIPRVHVWYEHANQNLYVVFTDVKSFFGIQVLNPRHLFLSAQLNLAESSKLCQIYDRILDLLFPIRNEFLEGLRNVNKITRAEHLHFLTSSTVQNGETDPQLAGIDHQYTVLVPSRIEKSGRVVDWEACVTSGTEHKDCQESCEGKTLAKLTIQIGPVYFKDLICVVARVREIVYDCSHAEHAPIVNSYTGTSNLQDDTGSESLDCGTHMDCYEGMCSLSWLEHK